MGKTHRTRTHVEFTGSRSAQIDKIFILSNLGLDWNFLKESSLQEPEFLNIMPSSQEHFNAGQIRVDVCAAQSNFTKHSLRELQAGTSPLRVAAVLWENWHGKAATSSLFLIHAGENFSFLI